MDIIDVKGIGPKTVPTLNKLGVYTVDDLVNYYPYRYDHYTVDKLDNIGNKTLVKAKVLSNPILSFIKKNFNRLSFNAEIDNKIIKVVIFNRHFLKNNLTIGKEIFISGKYEEKNNSLVAANILFKLPTNMIVPIYHLKSGITNNNINKFIIDGLKEYQNKEILPEEYIIKHDLITNKKALKIIHDPENIDDLKQAKAKLSYQELFNFTFKINYLKRQTKELIGEIKNIDEDKVNRFINDLSFKLTEDQIKAIDEIKKDMSTKTKMNRLIIGDVGSGKTIICVIASYINFLAGYQTAFMAPTEVLAIQHYNNIKKLFSKYDIRVELLIGSMTKKEKEEVNRRLANKDIDIIIGTHALISESTTFNNLGLVITDEQHRFGVNQRKLLNEKGNNPDALYLSATPIPRTYALALYGDLDVSLIKTKPSGRKTITTKQYSLKEMPTVIELIKKELDNNHQVFAISASIEDTDDEILNVKIIKKSLEKHFPDKNIEIMHGKLKSDKKEEIMKDFKDGKIDILVSTTVIEVGVDIPNATAMVIFNAEMFGLATLHQLRGRVGRNDLDCSCFLISESDSKRLKVLEESNDGFYISEQDFKMRNEGDIFGTKQSGTVTFKIADIYRDSKILLAAKKDSEEYINSGNYLNNKYYKDIANDIIAGLD
jgi:ATP-dependent DNA helicase RecG